MELLLLVDLAVHTIVTAVITGPGGCRNNRNIRNPLSTRLDRYRSNERCYRIRDRTIAALGGSAAGDATGCRCEVRSNPWRKP